MSGSPPSLDAVARWAATVPSQAVPIEQRRLARLRVLDTLGLTVAGLRSPLAPVLRVWRERFSGPGEATCLLDGEPASPGHAAFLHGALAHARDFDDTFIDSVIHPGSTIVPACLGVAEAEGTDFEDVLAAIAIGYEVAARLGGVAGRGFHARGFHATSVVGPIAAAAAVSRLYGLDPCQAADALGLSTSMSSGTLAFLGDGAWSKWMHTGWASQGGIVAAQLAASGFHGPRHALDHRYGLFGAFLGSCPELGPALADLGGCWLGSDAHTKTFPCAHVIQPYISAVLTLLSTGSIEADRIETLTCGIAPWAVPIVCEPRARKVAPENDMDAIASLPFLLAAALLDRRVDVDTLSASTLRRSDIRAMAERVRYREDPTLGEGFTGSLSVELASGEGLEVPVTALPPGEEAITAKFRSNVRTVMTDADSTSLAALVLTGSPDIGALVSTLAAGPGE